MAVLARLLAPEDFGVIAMASLVIGLADVLLNLGVHVPLIQNQDVTQDHYDSAWTLRLVQTGLSTAVIFALAPIGARYFGDPRVEIVLQVLSFQLILGGLENIGVVEFQKKMQFGAEFQLRITRRMIGFVTTLILAFSLRSYWALVAGMLTEKTAGLVLSFWMHPMRPRLSLRKFREIFGVSQWMLLLGVGQYLRRKLHRVLVGRWESAGVLGAYTLAHEIAAIPTTELLSPVNRPLFARLAQVQDDPIRLRDMFLLAQ